MARYSYSVIMRDTGVCLSYSGHTDDMEYSLPEMEYMMGIDQSTSCTGFYITNKLNTFHIIGDIVPDEVEKPEYIDAMEMFFRIFLRNAKMLFFISEKVPPTQNNKKYKAYYTSKVLSELKGTLDSWRIRIPALKRMERSGFDDIYTNSWRSAIIDKSKGPGRFNSKAAIVQDLCDIFPELRVFIPRCRSKDMDPFEACGILHGYLLKNFDPKTGGNHSADGGKMIAGDKSYRGSFYVFVTTSPEGKEVKLDDIQGFLNISIMKNGVKHLNMNPSHSLFSNYQMAASRNPITVTFIEDIQMKLTLQWQFDLPMNNDNIIAFIVRKGAIHGNDLQHLVKEFKYDQLS